MQNQSSKVTHFQGVYTCTQSPVFQYGQATHFALSDVCVCSGCRSIDRRNLAIQEAERPEPTDPFDCNRRACGGNIFNGNPEFWWGALVQVAVQAGIDPCTNRTHLYEAIVEAGWGLCKDVPDTGRPSPPFACRVNKKAPTGAAILELPEPDKRLDVLVMCSLKQGGGAAGSSESPAQRLTLYLQESGPLDQQAPSSDTRAPYHDCPSQSGFYAHVNNNNDDDDDDDDKGNNN
ncbi:hypothetical protein GRF29_161g730446 [Pseudopithomyces chartarum]|uniref:Uncharacterized protein n=1 Tax=Pseudopithomyces chartarum TaxID=1892770 RepID=A0AAN6LU52_9PLEO|nr:hypothetical protein GRF29_161g730446 [Pseudopithomyces chartarum]